MATRKSAAKSTRDKARTKAKPASSKPASKPTGGDARMAIDLDQLETLMQTLDRHGITELELEKGGERIVLRRGPAAVVTQAMPIAAMPAPSLPPPAASPATPAADEANVGYVTSPFVGTFYRAASPTSASFVEVGAKIRKGQTLCIVEAMKLMNEIESELDGTIVEVLAENGKPVEYGDRLFKVRR